MNYVKAFACSMGLLLAIGCQSTAEGVKQDTSTNSQKVAEGAQNMNRGAAEAGKDIGAATILTPKVKTAILADKKLNDPANLIDVKATDEKVMLEGHVVSEELKSLAAEIAKKTIKDNNEKQSVENNLVVKT